MIWQQLLETNSKCDNKTHQLDQVVGHHVLGAARDDHVRVLLGRDAELLEGGLDKARVVYWCSTHALPAGARLCPAQQAVPARAAAERVGLARGAEVGAALVLAGLAPRHPAPALPAPRHPVDLVELVQRLPSLPALVE